MRNTKQTHRKTIRTECQHHPTDRRTHLQAQGLAAETTTHQKPHSNTNKNPPNHTPPQHPHQHKHTQTSAHTHKPQPHPHPPYANAGPKNRSGFAARAAQKCRSTKGAADTQATTLLGKALRTCTKAIRERNCPSKCRSTKGAADTQATTLLGNEQGMGARRKHCTKDT